MAMLTPRRTLLKVIVLGDSGYDSVFSPFSQILKFLEDCLGGKDIFDESADPTDPETFPFVLFGNKVDIDDGNSRAVSEKTAKDWCASKGNIPYFETSAKEDYNVDDAFLCVAKTALANEHERDIKPLSIRSVSVEAPPTSGGLTPAISLTG
ncbi:hypothetical protein F0562_005685 [Nyssa sinensis]|uniref:Uncharacterized protein n=1 Tax=Nyssa sinensis TaxID=561372 RepID=A0A5J5AL35_9ASTE|nr:hypothetical protein F0562_005685 [Nyssa sinensis]